MLFGCLFFLSFSFFCCHSYSERESYSDSVLWKSGARINWSVRVHTALFHLFQFGFDEGYCSTCHSKNLFSFSFLFLSLFLSLFLFRVLVVKQHSHKRPFITRRYCWFLNLLPWVCVLCSCVLLPRRGQWRWCYNRHNILNRCYSSNNKMDWQR